MKKIFISGATGFIGSHLAELCVQKGYSVIAFDRYNSNNNHGWLENSKFKKDMKIILGDIRDYDSVFKSMKGCDTVFHLAALIGIPYSYNSPLAYLKTNVEGTYNVLESGKNQDIDQLVITSTSEVYGSAQFTPINEKHPLVGQSPYSASKIAADQLALSYHKSFKMPVKILRPFNTYGPRQSLRAVIPTIISQCLKENNINLGNIHPFRDFLYVEDTCKGFLEIAKSKKLLGEVANIGSGKEITIKNLTKLIMKISDTKKKINHEKKRTRPKNSEVNRLICDNKKIIKCSKWKPKVRLEEGIKRTLDWLKNSPSLKKSNQYII